MIKLNETKDEILLVRARDNLKWYLPGGKIEDNESITDSLIRELKEELSIELIPSTIKFQVTVQGPAYGINDNVELNCFTADYKGAIKPCAEISDAKYINWQMQRELLAPAVITMCDQWLDGAKLNL